MSGIPVLLGQKVLEEIHTSRATYLCLLQSRDDD